MVKTLSRAEVAAFIAAIPNLAAEWRPTSQGGTRRYKTDEIAARVAQAFQEADIECSIKVGLKKGNSDEHVGTRGRRRTRAV